MDRSQLRLIRPREERLADLAKIAPPGVSKQRRKRLIALVIAIEHTPAESRLSELLAAKMDVSLSTYFATLSLAQQLGYVRVTQQGGHLPSILWINWDRISFGSPSQADSTPTGNEGYQRSQADSTPTATIPALRKMPDSEIGDLGNFSESTSPKSETWKAKELEKQADSQFQVSDPRTPKNLHGFKEPMGFKNLEPMGFKTHSSHVAGCAQPSEIGGRAGLEVKRRNPFGGWKQPITREMLGRPLRVQGLYEEASSKWFDVPSPALQLWFFAQAVSVYRRSASDYHGGDRVNNPGGAFTKIILGRKDVAAGDDEERARKAIKKFELLEGQYNGY